MKSYIIKSLEWFESENTFHSHSKAIVLLGDDGKKKIIKRDIIKLLANKTFLENEFQLCTTANGVVKNKLVLTGEAANFGYNSVIIHNRWCIITEKIIKKVNKKNGFSLEISY